MTADIRVDLEEELDNLDESQVESWLGRCFTACDPRYDSDWLNGIFELAVMQFPNNFEVRAAASKAATMEAQRLFDDGDHQEAIGRLERLLENDPYCTDAFEMLERFMQASAVPAPEPAPLPVAPVVEAAPPAPEPLPIAPALPASLVIESEPAVDDLSFLDDDDLLDLSPELPPVSSSAEPEVQQPAAALLPPPPEPEPVQAVTVEPPAPPPVTLEVPVAPPAPAPVPPPPPPQAPLPLMVEAAAPRSSGFDWRSVVSLPNHGREGLEPQLEVLLPSLTERFCQAGNFRSLVLLLSDLLQRDSKHQGLRGNLQTALHEWAKSLEQAGRGPEAGQVAAWALQLLPETSGWATTTCQRFPATLPKLPDLTALASSSTPAWMAWVAPLREDPSRHEEAAQALSTDTQGLQSLFRHLAVHHPNDAEHVLNLGWAYSHTGQHALAMVHTQRSLQIQASQRAYKLLQKIYTDLGQPEMAQRAVHQLSQLST
jgi:tetratricopeptide (TPR) repeat protein